MPLEHVTWSRNMQYEGFRFSLGSVSDRDDWQRQFEWMFENLEKLNQVFRPFIGFGNGFIRRGIIFWGKHPNLYTFANIGF